jgi:hypothetical protein
MGGAAASLAIELDEEVEAGLVMNVVCVEDGYED